MGRVTARLDVGNVASLEELKRFVAIALKDIGEQINGNLNVENLSVQMLDVTFSSSGLVTRIPHSLGRPPLMWISGNLTGDSVIYEYKPSDATTLYLAASAPCSARILLI